MRQRGNIYVYLGAALAGLAMVSALVFGAIRYVNSVDEKAFDRGRGEAEAAYAQRDNDALRKAQAEVDRLAKRTRTQEAALAKANAEVDSRRQKEEDDARAQRERDIAAVRAGFRLRDPGCTGSATGPAGSGGSAGSPAPAPARVGDGATGCELSGAATEFLLGEADRADEVVRQLKAAQDLIKSYKGVLDGDQAVPRNP